MRKTVLLIVGSGLLYAACGGTPEPTAPDPTPEPTESLFPTAVSPEDSPEGSIAAVLRDDGRFSTFLDLSANVFVHSEVPRLLNMDRQWTVFAPTDEAFANVPPELMQKMRGDPKAAEEMFLHHHFDQPLISDDFELLASWPTALTVVKVVIESDDEGYIYDGVRVLETDIEAANGVIHVLDEVAGLELLED